MRPTTESRDHRAVSPLPRSMKSASSTSGVARSVERSARPAVVLVMNDLSSPPMTVGLEKGNGPTESTRPTNRRIRKYARSRQRTNAAATSAATGNA